MVRFVLPVVLTILYPGGGILYLHGRFSPYAETRMNIILLFPVALIFILWCFVTGIVRMVRLRRGRTRKQLLLTIAEICVTLVYVGLILVLLYSAQARSYWRSHDFFMLGLRDRIKSKVDVGGTRHWLQSLGAEEYEYGNRIFGAELPKSLGVRKNARARLWADENGNPKVRLTWGSAVMGHWGAVIGMEDMATPLSDFSWHGEYRMPVEPGVYVWEAIE